MICLQVSHILFKTDLSLLNLDGIGLKEYDAPRLFKNDTIPRQKPNLNSMRVYREIGRATEEEESSLSKGIYDMEIERSEEENSNSNNYLNNNEEYYEEERKVQVEFQPPTTQKTNFKQITKVERNQYRSDTQAMAHTQSSQNPEYVKKLAKALQGNKGGKQKYSQKNFYPSSSTFNFKVKSHFYGTSCFIFSDRNNQ